jgi:hypothetical protein
MECRKRLDFHFLANLHADIAYYWHEVCIVLSLLRPAIRPFGLGRTCGSSASLAPWAGDRRFSSFIAPA